MTCWFAVSLFVSRILNCSQRGHGSKKLFPFPPGICWWKGQKRFGLPWSWPPQICLEIRLCWKPAPGCPLAKRLRANCITKAGMPTGLPHFGGSVTLRSKIDLWWEENAFFFFLQYFPFSGTKGIFLHTSQPAYEQRPSRSLHSFNQDPLVQPVCYPEPSCPDPGIQIE